MNCFAHQKSKLHILSKIKIPVILFLLLFTFIWQGIDSVSSTSLDKQQESLETALSRDIAQCYAVEGTYPPSLEYLREHYALTYNDKLFFVDYQAQGANIMPDVTVIRKGGDPSAQ
ncbi:MAG: hypothetical protein PHP50_00765 [Lachnospiraceae bacterium]|nr:hypothetical protein [Lachnospiraceae bacterium]